MQRAVLPDALDAQLRRLAATYNRAVLIDGYVAAVFGISKMAADSIFVWYVMKAPHKLYRLGRLCYMLAQNQSFVDTLLDDIDQEKVTKMRTAMLTKYAENKEVRGIMKLVNRQEDAKNGYKLTYEPPLWLAVTRRLRCRMAEEGETMAAEESTAMSYEKIYDMGTGLIIAKVQLDKVREQDINARIMRKEMQDQLTANIKNRGQLESLPLLVEKDGVLEIISGHHRIKSARATGMKEIIAIIDVSACPAPRSHRSSWPTTPSAVSMTRPSCARSARCSTTWMICWRASSARTSWRSLWSSTISCCPRRCISTSRTSRFRSCRIR